ncbi:hypothetical protein NA57DRAFT_77035 [Rhizodiscina lignyota]|uniref:Uncharacterized protein n=1 Tax=Rhizodiscina lignyota TaxID=1504668 RepID=A0A9P4IF89_9PEZI|nr:hypothetical protein NA57DRAFT_77035 [Rhizodiscina lignyota]
MREWRNQARIHRRSLRLVIALLLLLLSLATLYARTVVIPTQRQCQNRMFLYSPASDHVHYQWTNFKKFYYPPSELVGPPTPEREQLWDEYVPNSIVSVPYDRISELGHVNNENWWAVAPEAGGGVAAVLAVDYQLNCLSLLHRYLYKSAYKHMFNHSQVSEHRLKAQKNLCLEVLRQELTCYADPTLYLNWRNPKSQKNAAADLGSWHKCRDYDAIRDWAWSHRIYNLHVSNVLDLTV